MKADHKTKEKLVWAEAEAEMRRKLKSYMK